MISSKIGITGSTGFIGKYLLKCLESDGHAVRPLDDYVHPRTPISVKRAYPETLDWVLHLGAATSISAAFDDPRGTYRQNVESTQAALDIALNCRARFLYMSSYVYGHPEYLPIDESHPVRALNPYMESKLAGEDICRRFADENGLDVIILRGFTFYGPGQTGPQLIASVLESIEHNKPVVVKDPSPQRDYLFIDDLGRLIDRVIISDKPGVHVYNIGGGKPYRNLDVARMIVTAAGNPVRIEVVGEPRQNDVTVCYAAIDKARDDFGWHPETSLEDGIQACLKVGLSAG